MGGIVAVETARQLAGAGQSVELVFLIDCEVPVPGPDLTGVQVLARFTRALSGGTAAGPTEQALRALEPAHPCFVGICERAQTLRNSL